MPPDAHISRPPDQTFALYSIKLQPLRHDPVEDQLRDVALAAARLGCIDAAEWILERLNV